MPIQVQPFNFGADIRNQNRADRQVTLQELALQGRQQAQGRQLDQRDRQLSIAEDRSEQAAQQLGMDRNQYLASVLQDTVAQTTNADEALRYMGYLSDQGLAPQITPELEQFLRSQPEEAFGQAFRKQALEERRVDVQERNSDISADRLDFDKNNPINQAKLTKAEADARVAETKAAEAEKKQAGEDSTSNDIVTLADGLLSKPETVRSVYGTTDGVLPSILPTTVDAEADLRRLVNMLTLENTSKMSGVLSESDIKILASAGTVLSNFRISDEKAIAELERIRDVFNRNPGALEEIKAGPQSFDDGTTVEFID